MRLAVRASVLGALVFTMACNATIGAGPSPSVAVSARPVASARSSSPAAGAFGFKCRLPVRWWTGEPITEHPTLNVGWLALPGGTLEKQAASPLVFDAATSLYATAQQPVLRGTGGPFYDRAKSRWLPVGQAAVSPDGSRYAYSDIVGADFTTATGRLHVVDVGSGSDRVLTSGPKFSIVDFSKAGVYLAEASAEGLAHNLWLLDPDSGGLRQLGADQRTWTQVAAGGAYGPDFDPADPNPARSAFTPSNRVAHLDLSSGSVATWYSRPGANLHVIAVDAEARAVVRVLGATGSELQVLRGPDEAARIAQWTEITPYGWAGERPSAPFSLDEHGLWLSTFTAVAVQPQVWFYSQAAGLHQVIATAPPGTAIAVAGGCV